MIFLIIVITLLKNSLTLSLSLSLQSIETFRHLFGAAHADTFAVETLLIALMYDQGKKPAAMSLLSATWDQIYRYAFVFS